MVFNRTQKDVDDSRQIIIDKVQKFQELTESEIETLEKGVLTINTLNRIENKENELKNSFNKIGYWNTYIVNKNWFNSDFFYESDFKRIIENINILKKAFFSYSDIPTNVSATFHFENINTLEKILYLLDTKINDVKSHYRQCGTFYCGEVNEN